jgi:hypothetical protein
MVNSENLAVPRDTPDGACLPVIKSAIAETAIPTPKAAQLQVGLKSLHDPLQPVRIGRGVIIDDGHDIRSANSEGGVSGMHYARSTHSNDSDRQTGNYRTLERRLCAHILIAHYDKYLVRRERLETQCGQTAR